MKIKYENWNPKPASLELVNVANDIITDFAAQDLILTLRQLYYRMVKDNIIENSERSYKNLGTLVTKARNAGLISWEAIEDRNRQHNTYWSYEDDLRLIKNLDLRIQFDQWERQENYVEVWVEKEALGNIVQKACDPLFVPHMACKGYLSASEAWRAGQRIDKMEAAGKRCTIIHLGDHDPSGIDMTRDNQSRINLYGQTHNCEVKRIALNMDQIQIYNPPPNPTKLKDSRSSEYIKRYGRKSWELDALEPQVMIDLITDTINPLIDWEVWQEVSDQEEVVAKRLRKLGDNWDSVSEYLQSIDDE